MVKIKKSIISISILILILSTNLASNAQNNNSPTLTVTSVNSQQIPYNQVNLGFNGFPKTIGNIWYSLLINYTFVFPQNINFTGIVGNSFNCGMDVSLVNTSDWQIAIPLGGCPYLGSPEPVSAGTYKLSGFLYLNTLNNYTNANFPKKIGFYVYTPLNDPQYKSNNYFFNLSGNKSQTIFHIFSNNIILFLFSGIIISAVGIYIIVEYRNYRKNKSIKTDSQSFRKYLVEKNDRQNNGTQTLKPETLEKLEEIISENSK